MFNIGIVKKGQKIRRLKKDGTEYVDVAIGDYQSCFVPYDTTKIWVDDISRLPVDFENLTVNRIQHETCQDPSLVWKQDLVAVWKVDVFHNYSIGLEKRPNWWARIWWKFFLNLDFKRIKETK
jgi:hypothetical protein